MDASAAIEYLLRTRLGREVASVIEAPEVDLHVPALCDVEVLAGLRAAVATGLVDPDRALQAIGAYCDLPLTVHGHRTIAGRVLELSGELSAFDAVYVALCERLGATLVTGDALLTKAVKGRLPLNVIGVGDRPS